MKRSYCLYAFLFVIGCCLVALNLVTALVLKLTLTSVMLVSLLLAVVLLCKQRNESEDHARQLENELAVLNAKLSKSEDIRSRFRKVLTEMSENADKAGSGGAAREVCAEKYLASFHKNYVSPYLDYLMSVEMPLSQESKQKIINDTVELAMLSLDMSDAYDWDINNREEQNINCELLLRRISKEEAMASAIEVTENPYETPRWIRALNESLKDVISQDSRIILSGYKASYEENI